MGDAIVGGDWRAACGAAAEDVLPVRFAGGFDGFRETLMATAPLLVGGAGDAEEGAGIVDRFALGEEVEEVFLPVLALAGFGLVGTGLEFEGFSVGGLHVFCFLSSGGADVAMPGCALRGIVGTRIVGIVAEVC